MFCSVHDSEAAVVMNHSVNTQAGIFTKKKRMDPVRDQPTSEKAVPAAINTIAEYPSSICHWRGEMLSSHLSIIIYQLIMGSLRKTPLESPHEQGECVGFVCRKLQRIPLSWPPPMSCKIGPIFALITSTINEL